MATILPEGVKEELLNLIKMRGALPLHEASEILELAKSTVRQHLLAMENQKLVKRRYERAGPGRPQVLFELDERAHQLYPTQQPIILKELLEYLKSNNQSESIQTFFEEYWNERKSRFQDTLSGLSGKITFEKRLSALRSVLEFEGFMPQIERGKATTIVSECHCPYPDVVKVTQIPCKLESQFIQWALKADVDRTHYIPSGDSACAYKIKSCRESK